MPTPHKPARGASTDALDLLKADHDKVKNLFREFAALHATDQDERKADLVDAICYELTVHTMLEEDIFYPLVRAAIDDDALMDEAWQEHAGARALIRQLEVMDPGDAQYDAAVASLGEEVAQHIDREESDIFDAVRTAGIDLDDLGERLSARKDELDDDLSASAPGVDTFDAIDPRDAARPMRRPPRAPT